MCAPAALPNASSEGTDGPVRVTLDDGSEIEGDELLVATDRTANTEDIGLDAVGIEPGGFLEVDDQMRVGGRDWLFAVGDVNGRRRVKPAPMARRSSGCVCSRPTGRSSSDRHRPPMEPGDVRIACRR